MTSFGKEVMEQVSREAMPNVPVIDREWLTGNDNYYHQTTTSFELGRHKPAYVLPVLRVSYNDLNQTWLYFTPSLAQMVKFDKRDRANRWVYYGLHVMDWPGLFNRRPLWDIVTIVLLAGLAAISITTLLPAFRRLKRHAVCGWRRAFARNKVRATHSPAWAMSDSDRISGDRFAIISPSSWAVHVKDSAFRNRDIVKGACLEPLGLSVTEGAKVLGGTRQTLTKIVNGSAGVSAEMPFVWQRHLVAAPMSGYVCRQVTILHKPARTKQIRVRRQLVPPELHAHP
jgi:hypothetical protein